MKDKLEKQDKQKVYAEYKGDSNEFKVDENSTPEKIKNTVKREG